ncbi:hypothetical protein AY601_3720 [Pedobacter cryoconitis]|uniref:Uncharacterized protein n=1 Tax=Pedobacter cryoconitis TaxID=188932 RepID=A0A127VH93_9SPHI|nr:hypothetical protein [Pedobacter cryoconitis]AMQ00582.1 hypothetical protein AY601_3720 [Pedobacter cryoconitis]
MLIKLNLITHAFARSEREKQEKALTQQQWVTVDRIVMLILFLGVIAGAIIFS